MTNGNGKALIIFRCN